MILVTYFNQGQKHGYEAVDYIDAVNRKYALTKQYGKGFWGCSNFYYDDESGRRIYL